MDEKKIKVSARIGHDFHETKLGITIQATDGIRFLWLNLKGHEDKDQRPYTALYNEMTRDEFNRFVAEFNLFIYEAEKLFWEVKEVKEELENVQINDETTQENS